MTQKLAKEKRIGLTKLIRVLMRFAMLLGGFGKSWRRVDHRLFYEQYYEGNKKKPLIGCHWNWYGKSMDGFNLILSPKQLTQFFKTVTDTARAWMQLEGMIPKLNASTDWREAWNKDNVQVWGRVAANLEDSKAVEWFHAPYRSVIREIKRKEGSIYRTDLTGSMSQISRLWHRMYPLAKKRRNPPPNQPEYGYPSQKQYLELLTIFSDRSANSKQFLEFLSSQQSEFKQYL